MNHDLSYYRTIQGTTGATSAKESQIRQRKAELNHYFEMSQDCEDTKVNGTDQKLVITKSTDPALKHVVSKPEEAIYLGDIITWNSTDWILDTIDSDTRINSKGKMRRCNIVIKWLDESGATRSYSGYCEDATKYSEGVTGDKMMQIGDFQIKVKIRLDEHSAKLNRDKRFLLDAVQFLPQMEATGSHPSAYIVTRRNVLTGSLGGHGYVELTMVETAYSQNDNPTLMIADYYNADDVYTLTVSNADITVARGANFTITCSATKNGTTLDQTSILFQSSNTAIATVSASGRVTGVANGKCTVTVKAGNIQKSVEITVYNVVPEYVIHIEPVDNDFNIAYGTTKIINISITSNNTKLPYGLLSEIICDEAIATVSVVNDTQIVVSAINSSSKVGETFILRVSETGRNIVAEKVFKIVGWF